MAEYKVVQPTQNKHNVTLANSAALRIDVHSATVMAEYKIAKPTHNKYNVASANSAALRVDVHSATLRPAVTYVLDTPANNFAGTISLVTQQTNVIADTIPIVGTGLSTVTSNGSAIIVDTTGIGTIRLDQLADVQEGLLISNNSTLVYDISTDKYVVKMLDIDGGSF